MNRVRRNLARLDIVLDPNCCTSDVGPPKLNRTWEPKLNETVNLDPGTLTEPSASKPPRRLRCGSASGP
ncbi:hypothetical protein HYPDE_40338 [Hyphomicrobium denitrificans 1NES1]|uniref:Uncharacterized protein n=1 Tax=Hyphomicrobium denitrificans 1NES1 TaxID=670307 RepID=N0BH15_9HYPH|nr:hypothetical protein HYPDE_40338 [Hyphomicrobium denitrificans 1NES1]